MEERLKVLLNNAITTLIDETFEQYDDVEDWKSMLENGLCCTMDELQELGIDIEI